VHGRQHQCQIDQCDCTGPGNCFWDLDNSYATGCEYQCDLTNSGVEICDGIDNDCDGKIDARTTSPMIRARVACQGDPDSSVASRPLGLTPASQIACVRPTSSEPGLETCSGSTTAATV
jgi:hypothetical protein